MRRGLYIFMLFVCGALLSCQQEPDCFPKSDSLSLLTTEVAISNGDSFELQFELSQSNYNVDLSNLSIEDMMPSSDDEHIPYTIVDVKRVSAHNNGDKSAQWVATIKSDSGDEKPYGGKIELFLVVSARGQFVKSATPITVTNYPRLSEKIVNIHCPYAQSYMTLEVHDWETRKDAQLASAYLYARLVEPMPCYYDKRWITMTVTLEDTAAPFIVAEVDNEDKLMFRVTPTEDIFATDSRDYIPVRVNIRLSDKFQNTITKDVEIKFYRSLIILPAGEKFTYNVREPHDDDIRVHTLDFSKLLPRLGVTPEFMQIHSQSAFSLASNSWIVESSGRKSPGLPLGFDNLMALDFTDLDSFKTVEVIDMLDNSLSNDSFASMYLIVSDPYTRAVMIGAEIRQEVRFINE